MMVNLWNAVSAVIAVVGCLVGVLGWTSGRDKRITMDAQWRGSVDAKLDMVVGIRKDVDQLDRTVTNHGERLAKVEASSAQAHHRIDEIVKGDKP